MRSALEKWPLKILDLTKLQSGGIVDPQSGHQLSVLLWANLGLWLHTSVDSNLERFNIPSLRVVQIDLFAKNLDRLAIEHFADNLQPDNA